MNRKTLLSTLWIFVTINYLYCDLIGLMDASLLKQYLTGNVEGMKINENFLLAAGVLMEIPISMILFAKILKDKPNAIVNVVAASIKTSVMILTLFLGKPTIYYLFFATIEISTTIFIFIYAIGWLKEINALKPSVS
ncbi:DUF6326 family protein [Emticicia sp. W12TSBA100-4]|uniref:DUF6326 family protein n=1 Tax=Emticicia sp. W12TSBA100-4 TaxID=3160965 RepID=UPI0033059D86